MNERENMRHRRSPWRCGLLAACLLVAPAGARALDVDQSGNRLTVTGQNFRYTWSGRRGWELAVVEQRTRPTT